MTPEQRACTHLHGNRITEQVPYRWRCLACGLVLRQDPAEARQVFWKLLGFDGE